MMGIKEDLLLWFINFFDKTSTGSGVNIRSEFNKQLAEEFTNQLLENLKKEKFILDLEIIFGKLI